jgi:peptidoglycan biosynthesis protein MviN/MurJ (putative lipid II flippase)
MSEIDVKAARRGADRIMAIGSVAVIGMLVASLWLDGGPVFMALGGLAGATMGLGVGAQVYVNRLGKIPADDPHMRSPRWWQYLLCPIVAVWVLGSLIGFFVFHNGLCGLGMLVFALCGTVVAFCGLAREIWRGIRGPRP